MSSFYIDYLSRNIFCTENRRFLKASKQFFNSMISHKQRCNLQGAISRFGLSLMAKDHTLMCTRDKFQTGIELHTYCMRAWSASQQLHATPAVRNPNLQPKYAGPEQCSVLGTVNRQSNRQRMCNLNLDVRYNEIYQHGLMEYEHNSFTSKGNCLGLAQVVF